MKRSTLNSYDTYPKNIFAQNALYCNMSHHYRRLYNAKPRVDTSTPKSYKLQKQKEKNLPMNVYNRCIPDLIVSGKSVLKKNGITVAHQTGCKEEINKNYVLADENCVPYRPKILKTNVQSKLLSSRVYHPPRKKVSYADSSTNKRRVVDVIPSKFNDSLNKIEDGNYDYEDDGDWLQLPSQEHQDARSGSKPSSSDSAYTEEGEGLWSGRDSRDDSPQQIHLSQPVSQGDNYMTDNRYVKFLRNITDEVLRKGIYTNKALKKVFQEHIYKNRHNLDMQRMQEEVEKLQIDLGIPKDDDLNDLDYGLGCGGDNYGDPDYILLNDHSNSIENRLGSSTDVPHMTELIETVDKLTINSAVKEDTCEMEDQLNTKMNESNCSITNNNDLYDNIRLPLKLPVRDNDNDSSIGCELLSDSEIEITTSNGNNLGER